MQNQSRQAGLGHAGPECFPAQKRWWAKASSVRSATALEQSELTEKERRTFQISQLLDLLWPCIAGRVCCFEAWHRPRPRRYVCISRIRYMR